MELIPSIGFSTYTHLKLHTITLTLDGQTKTFNQLTWMASFCSSLQHLLDTQLNNSDYSSPNEQPLSIKDDIVTPFDGDNWPMT